MLILYVVCCYQWLKMILNRTLQREPLTTPDVTTANVSTEDVTTANVTTVDVLVLGYGLWVRVWVMVWVKGYC